MRIHAASRPKDDQIAQEQRWVVEADDYDQGMIEVRKAIPEGWVLVTVWVEQ